MLALAWIELIFFMVDAVGCVLDLCWKQDWQWDLFVISELGLHRAKVLSVSPTAMLARSLGVHKELRGKTAITTESKQPKRYPITQCHAYFVKLGEAGKGRLSEWGLCLPEKLCDEALFSWRWLNICLPMGSREWIPCFVLFACTAFALPIKMSLSQPTSFLIFTLPVLFPSCWRGNDWAVTWHLFTSWD